MKHLYYVPLHLTFRSPIISLHQSLSAATIADFAIKNAKNSVTISAITASIELPLALKDDNDIEGDERFLCFFTSDHVSVRSGRVLLTVIDNDKGKCLPRKRGCTINVTLQSQPFCNSTFPKA